MPRKSVRKLSEMDFVTITEGMSISESLLKACFLYMCQDVNLQELEISSHHKKQVIQRKAREIWERYESLKRPVPPDWIKDSVVLPKEQMQEVKDLSERLLDAYYQTKSRK